MLCNKPNEARRGGIVMERLEHVSRAARRAWEIAARDADDVVKSAKMIRDTSGSENGIEVDAGYEQNRRRTIDE